VSSLFFILIEYKYMYLAICLILNSARTLAASYTHVAHRSYLTSQR